MNAAGIKILKKLTPATRKWIKDHLKEDEIRGMEEYDAYNNRD
jgi:hypothetical protein